MSERTGIFVKSIYVCPSQGEAMQKTTQARAIPEKGLATEEVEDRYAANIGFWQIGVKKPRPIARDISIILASDIQNSGFEDWETRRNIILEGDTDDIDFEQWIDQIFSIGEVVVRGEEICTPCKRPSDLCGKEGFAEKFKGKKGGLRAKIISEVEGVIYESDEVLPPQQL